GTRMNIEGGFPIYEGLDGPQLSTRWLISAGLTYSFRGPMRDADRHLLLARTFAARRLFSLAALLSVACFYFQAPHQASAQSLSSREYEIKAAYLYNFIKYVVWPSYGDTISIGVLGSDPFGPALAPLNGKTVKGRRLVIKHLDSV